MEFQIAQISDCQKLSEFVNSAYRGEQSKSGWTTEADLLDGIRTNSEELQEIISTPNNIIMMATLQGKLLGSVHLANNGSKCYLGMLTVDPKTQNQGIGKKLIGKSVEFAKSLGCLTIEITVITLRKELIEFYQRQGFRPTEKFIDFPSDPKFGSPKVPDLKMQYFELQLQ
jgi:ribosomal protein S18 acetylase RimI-like enzyme